MTIQVHSTRHNQALLQSAFGVRYRGYRHENFIEENESGVFVDEFDLSPNTETFTASVDGHPAGTIRVLHRRPDEPWSVLTACSAFGDVLDQALPADACCIEVNRFAVEPQFQGLRGHRVKLALLKAALMTAAESGIEHVIGAVRSEHMPFYQNFLGMTAHGSPRRYPGLRFDATLMVGNVAGGFESLRRTLPALVPDAGERQRWSSEREIRL